MKWTGLALVLGGGLLFVFNEPNNMIGMGIGMVLFVVGMFAMEAWSYRRVFHENQCAQVYDFVG